jgi:hypothetical protein
VSVEPAAEVAGEAGKESPKMSRLVDEDGVGDRVMELRPFTMIAGLPVLVPDVMEALDETVGIKLVSELMEALDLVIGTGIALVPKEVEALEVGTQSPPAGRVMVEVTVTVKAPNAGEGEGAAVATGLD